MLKKVILTITLLVIGWWTVFAVAPSFQNNFANYLTDATPDKYGRVETVFNICIDRNLSLMDNIRNLFYPNPTAVSACGSYSQWWQLWIIIRALWFIILFVFLVVTGINFIMKAKEPDAAKKAFSSLIYILYGAFLVFGVTRILGTVLNVGDIKGSGDLVNSVQNKLFLQILSFFKVLAFFAAIIMLVVYGFRMMSAMDKSDKVKIAQKWAINVIIALVMIKVIDYLFYIAQTPAFGAKASDMIVNVAITLWWILWAIFVLALFYAWYLLITSSGKEEAMKKAKSVIVNIFIVTLVIFLFLLIVYQIFNEFA